MAVKVEIVIIRKIYKKAQNMDFMTNEINFIVWYGSGWFLSPKLMEVNYEKVYYHYRKWFRFI